MGGLIGFAPGVVEGDQAVANATRPFGVGPLDVHVVGFEQQGFGVGMVSGGVQAVLEMTRLKLLRLYESDEGHLYVHRRFDLTTDALDVLESLSEGDDRRMSSPSSAHNRSRSSARPWCKRALAAPADISSARATSRTRAPSW